MRSHKIVPIKYKNKCLIFSHYKEKKDHYISCKVNENAKSYYVGCGCWGAYCIEFRYGYIKCVNFIQERKKRGVIVYA